MDCKLLASNNRLTDKANNRSGDSRVTFTSHSSAVKKWVINMITSGFSKEERHSTRGKRKIQETVTVRAILNGEILDRGKRASRQGSGE